MGGKREGGGGRGSILDGWDEGGGGRYRLLDKTASNGSLLNDVLPGLGNPV